MMDKRQPELCLPQRLGEIMDDVLGDVDLHPSDIPAIDLYLDQILSLVSDRMAQGSPRYRDNILTKTMVNNYSKDGLIKPVKGKKYAKEHIVQMLLVYTLKSSMSIGEIKRLICGVGELPDFDDADLIHCYESYLENKDDTRSSCRQIAAELLSRQQLDIADDKDFVVFLLDLLTVSSYLGNLARALLTERYPDPDSKEKDRDKDKDKDKEKEKDREQAELEKQKKEQERQKKEQEKETERRKKDQEKLAKAQEKAEKAQERAKEAVEKARQLTDAAEAIKNAEQKEVIKI